MNHDHWIDRTLELARRGAGQVSPNPMVGAVIVDEGGRVLGEGWHAEYGGPHAEVAAVRAALAQHDPETLTEATIYVNLEPCSHHGKTPPCADLILEHEIPRVVVGMEDPYHEVAGRGIRRLREQGVEVTVGVLERECRRLNEAFVTHLRTGRPLLTLKVAQTLDGRIATRSGHSRWVSGPDARTRVHRWRAEMDAVLVGSGTARADDPALTVRHVAGPQPLRIVLDREGALPADLQLFSDEHASRTIAVVGTDAEPEYAERLDGAGGQLWRVGVRDGHLDLGELLDRLGRGEGLERSVQSLLVEAGPGLATALFAEDLVDRYFCFLAPKVLGAGKPSVGELGAMQMDDALRFAEATWEMAGDDLLFRGYRRAV